MIPISITENTDLAIAVLQFKSLKVAIEANAFHELSNCADMYASRYSNTTIADIPGVEYSRRLFRKIGIDPTKRRPSSEALLRRAIKGKPLFSVNTLVNVGNWCSLDFLWPIGIYDAAKISGAVTMGVGGSSDSYDAINGEHIQFENRYIVSDEKGAFGSPMTDSL